MESEFEEIDKKNGWGGVYQNIRHACSDYKFTCKDARKAENKNLNRYRDVSPYDHTRVRLERGDKDYINASLVRVPLANRAYILTQGPLPTTAGHFWLMIYEQRTKAVLMLNRVIEKNTPKCYQYWPLGSANEGEDDIVLDDVGLKISYRGETQADNYTLRQLRLIDLQSGEEKDIMHFHYTAWPDFGVPESPSAFLNFLMAVRDSGALDPDVGPAVVHCSAGIGRSGTFCLVDSCLVLVEERKEMDSVNVQTMLLEMRKYRMGLIQTPDQLRFSYLAIIQGAKAILHSQINSKQDGNWSGEVNGKEEEEDESDRGEEDSPSVPPPLPPRFDHRPPPVLPLQDAECDDDEEEEEESIIDGEDPSKYDEERPLHDAVRTVLDAVAADRERELELRKRRRRDRKEQLAQKVERMRQKQLESVREPRSRRRFSCKQLGLGLVLLMSTGILMYKYYSKG